MTGGPVLAASHRRNVISVTLSFFAMVLRGTRRLLPTRRIPSSSDITHALRFNTTLYGANLARLVIAVVSLTGLLAGLFSQEHDEETRARSRRADHRRIGMTFVSAAGGVASASAGGGFRMVSTIVASFLNAARFSSRKSCQS